MQTFLPSSDFWESAQILDNDRLACQIKEGYQILQALILNKGWIHHPATRMWAGHEWELCVYLDVMDAHRQERGYWPHAGFTLANELCNAYLPRRQLEWPAWLGHEPFHISHQSNLIRKDPFYYGPRFPGVPDNLEYFWPTKEGF